MKASERIRNIQAWLNTDRTELNSSEGDYALSNLSAIDRETILTYSRTLERQDCSERQHLQNLTRALDIATEVGGLTASLNAVAPAEDILNWVKRRFEDPKERGNYIQTVRSIARQIQGGKDRNAAVLEVLSEPASENHRRSESGKMLLRWQDDILPLIRNGATNTLEQALFAVQFETGLNPGNELIGVEIDDVKVGEGSARISVTTGTTDRVVTVILAKPYLRRWLRNHPGRDNTSALWTVDGINPLTLRNIRRRFHRAGDRVKLKKTASPEMFRASNSGWLSYIGKSDSYIAYRQGRDERAVAGSRYFDYADQATISSDRIYDSDIAIDMSDDYAPRVCPYCRHSTPKQSPICMWCSLVSIESPNRIHQ